MSKPCVLGEFDGSGRLQLFFHGQQVADLDMSFIHDGLPQITKEAVYHKPVLKQEKLPKVMPRQDLDGKFMHGLKPL